MRGLCERFKKSSGSVLLGSGKIEDALKVDSEKQLKERMFAYVSTKSLPVLDEIDPRERHSVIASSRKYRDQGYKTRAGSLELSQKLLKNLKVKKIRRLGPYRVSELSLKV